MKPWLILTVGLLVFSCDSAFDFYASAVTMGKQLYYGDFSEIETPEDLWPWIQENIYYVSDRHIDEWVNPEVTFNRGYGDCDDRAILACNILYVNFGIKADIIVVDRSVLYEDDGIQLQILAGGLPKHVMIVYNGLVAEPAGLGVVGSFEDLKDSIGYIYYFEDIFY